MPKQPSLFPQKRGPIKQKRTDVFQLPNRVAAAVILDSPAKFEGVMVEWARKVMKAEGGAQC